MITDIIILVLVLLFMYWVHTRINMWQH